MTSLKYEHPKILLLDLHDSVAKVLSKRGFDAIVGSLGTPYPIPVKGGFVPVSQKADLPYEYKESEIVIIDLHYELARASSPITSEIRDGVETLVVSGSDGYVNPRLFNGRTVREDFDRILNSGGVFVVFADVRETQEFTVGSGFLGSVMPQSSEEFSNYDILSVTSNGGYIKVGNDRGSAISLGDFLSKDSSLGLLLSSYLKGTRYRCTVGPWPGAAEEWLILLKNKFGDSVGGALIPKGIRQGYIFFLPEIQDKTSFLVDFVEQFLPSLVPGLFPELEQSSWVYLPEYELPEIQKLKGEIVEVQEQIKSQVVVLEQQIQDKRQANDYLFELVRGTGDNLVAAVNKCLGVLGFCKIIDVDQQLREAGVNMQNREDLQIHDDSSALVVEIKGISGLPTDDDALTVQKYVVLRMREWQRTDVQGISIINHQRNLPPLERENATPFRQEIIDAAEEQSIGLLTAWDLHRLARSFLKNQWEHDDVRQLFYNKGRIDPVPSHYVYIGTIERFMEKYGVVGIQVEKAALQKGDRIAFELPIAFEEQLCESLEHENQPIEIAEPGMLVGLTTHLDKQQARKGVRVFKVTAKPDKGECDDGQRPAQVSAD